MRTLPAVTIILSLLGGVRPGLADSWVVVPGEAQTVGFHSKAPLESFDGSTHGVTGAVTLDPAAPHDGFAIEIRVDLVSLDTGIAMRNQNMRENHLHTDRFPQATFRADSITAGADAALGDGASHDLTVAGVLDLHGTKRAISVVLTLLVDQDGLLHIAGGFPVSLSDYGIPRPRFLFAKLGEVQQVFVDLRGTRPTP